MVEYARLITKSSEGPPTIPPSASHDNGDWSPNDIYEHELYMDSLTGYTYTRNGDTIVLLSTGEGFSKWIEVDVLNGGADPLPKMAVCYFKTSSSSADTPEVLLADNSSEATSSKTMGLLKDTIAPGDTGKLILVGEYDQFDTSAYDVGDRLWLGNFGGIVTIAPAAPRHAVFLGIVSRSHHTKGRICVSIQNGYELEELHNVTATNVTPTLSDEVLVRTVSDSLWKRSTVNDLANVLETVFDFAYVPQSRTITINGVTQDLSANRTFTIPTDLTVGTTPIASGTIGRVLFQGTGNVLQQSSSLSFDSAANRFQVGNNVNILAANTFPTNLNSPYVVLGPYNANFGGDQGALFNLTNNSTTGNSAAIFRFGITSPATGAIGEFGATSSTFSGFPNLVFFNTKGTFPLAFLTNDTERLRIHGTTGNIGINTTTDAGFRLDVNGTARVSGNLFLASTYLTASGAQLGIGLSNPNAYYKAGISGNLGVGGLIVLSTDVSGSGTPVYLERTASLFNVFSTLPMTFSVGSEAMRIFGTTRNIGINTTTDAGYKLDVNGTARVQTSAYFATTSGSVGIGTASPQDKLDINGSLRIRANSSSFTAVSDTSVIDYVPSTIFTTEAAMRIVSLGSGTVGGGIRFFTRNLTTDPDERMRITANGNVLIGTATNGASKLRVVGLPTSSAGLSSGDVWNDGGTLKIV